MINDNFFQNPIFFEKNRVSRVYKGGKLLGGFFSDGSTDGEYPEEWIASTVEARKGKAKPNEGLSIVKGESPNVTFRDLAAQYKYELFGEQGNLNILVKILDSAVRLPAQTHPDKEFARKHFNSEFGKTESWIVLGTRENAKIYYGFKDGVTRADLEKAISDSDFDRDSMTRIMNETDVKPGDVYLIPARVIHAIGAGCLILEVQEPTDFTIEPERYCGDRRLSDADMYIGLDKKTAVDCFDLTISGEKALKLGRKQPLIVFNENNALVEKLIDENDTPCFSVNKITVKNGGSFTLAGAPAIYVVTNGAGQLICEKSENKVFEISKGSYFFMPFMAKGKYKLTAETGIEIFECR
jgi:mannose-6-phosphate isomerase